MAKEICPNGHIYDSSIYGDSCPLCPAGTAAPAPSAGSGGIGNTRINVSGTGSNTSSADTMNPNFVGTASAAGDFGRDASGETIVKHHVHDAAHPQAQGPKPGATMIRPPKGSQKVNGRKLVGFLVTYNRYPLGKYFPLYEGKNFIGRNPSCEISVPDDSQISGRHMMILFRNIDNKFKYRDEQSSNGTFVNKELSDEGELENYDIIRLGNTIFIFIAIPQP